MLCSSFYLPSILRSPLSVPTTFGEKSLTGEFGPSPFLSVPEGTISVGVLLLGDDSSILDKSEISDGLESSDYFFFALLIYELPGLFSGFSLSLVKMQQAIAIIMPAMQRTEPTTITATKIPPSDSDSISGFYPVRLKTRSASATLPNPSMQSSLAV